jgi:adenine-specific DNA-methyltransferase
MPRKKRIEQYEHKGKTRINNPEVGLVDAALDPPEKKKTYSYDPHLDPQLQWAGKTERTSFEIPSVSLHVHERIDPRTIIEAVRRKNGNGAQMSLFSAREMNPRCARRSSFTNIDTTGRTVLSPATACW